jgi:hypothetical protein
MLAAAGLGSPPEHTLISLLPLNGLWPVAVSGRAAWRGDL